MSNFNLPVLTHYPKRACALVLLSTCIAACVGCSGSSHSSAPMPVMVVVPGKPINEGKLTTTPIKMSKYPTTFEQYDAYATATGKPKPDDDGYGRGNRAVINVSWDDAVAYAAWLSAKTGKTFQLPSDEQWDYAARDGSAVANGWGQTVGKGNYEALNPLEAMQMYLDNIQIVPVGSFQPNSFGLYDMPSNLWEWTQTCYDSSSPCDLRAVRGGSADGLRSWDHPSSRFGNYTFRLVQDY
jgi:formylglycine-generating enzyme required for sulfatase activity